MASFRSLSEIYIQEQVKANVLSTLVESRRKSLDTLTRENETLRRRADQLQQKIVDLEAEIEEENELAKSRNKRTEVEMLLERVLNLNNNNKNKNKVKNKITKDTKTQTEPDKESEESVESDSNTSSNSDNDEETDADRSSKDTGENTPDTSTDDVTQSEENQIDSYMRKSVGKRGRSMVDLLTTILPPSPNDEQVRAYLTLLGHSKVTEAFAKLLQGTV